MTSLHFTLTAVPQTGTSPLPALLNFKARPATHKTSKPFIRLDKWPVLMDRQLPDLKHHLLRPKGPYGRYPTHRGLSMPMHTLDGVCNSSVEMSPLQLDRNAGILKAATSIIPPCKPSQKNPIKVPKIKAGFVSPQRYSVLAKV
jgi:hypothetical protein